MAHPRLLADNLQQHHQQQEEEQEEETDVFLEEYNDGGINPSRLPTATTSSSSMTISQEKYQMMMNMTMELVHDITMVKEGDNVWTAYGNGICIQTTASADKSMQVALSFGTLYHRQPEMVHKFITEEEYDLAMDHLEQVRKFQWTVQCEQWNVPPMGNEHECVACLFQKPHWNDRNANASSNKTGRSWFRRQTKMTNATSATTTSTTSSNTATKHTKKQSSKKHKKCDVCGNPVCSKHAIANQKQMFCMCVDCQFDLTNVVEQSQQENASANQPTNLPLLDPNHPQLSQTLDRLLQYYTRMSLHLSFWLPVAGRQLANALTLAEKRNSQVALGTGSLSFVGAALGVAGAAALMTPAGPAILLAAVCSSATSATIQGTHAGYHRFMNKSNAQINALCDQILGWHGLCLGILNSLDELRYNLLQAHETVLAKLEQQHREGKVAKRSYARRTTTNLRKNQNQRVLSSKSSSKALEVWNTLAMGSFHTTRHGLTGVGLTSAMGASYSQVISASIQTVPVVGAAFSVGCMALDASNIASAISKLQKPSDKAVALQHVEDSFTRHIPSTIQVEVEALWDAIYDLRDQQEQAQRNQQQHLIEQELQELNQHEMTPSHAGSSMVCIDDVSGEIQGNTVQTVQSTTLISTNSDSNDTLQSSLVPGETRIRDQDGFVGTVVYVGPVASSKNPTEVYAGIVWDDSSRGKHDGSVICRQTNQIVRHFSCGPTQGSFLRLRKLDTGVMLTASLLKTKYVEMNAPVIAPNNVLPHSAVTSSGREKSIEFLGELKIRERQQLEDIDKISLRREGISKACDDCEDLSEFQQIKEIDLAGNLLCNWDHVLTIMKQFPLLEQFSVAHNFIRDIIPTSNYDTITFHKMKVLNLNNCSIKSFKTIQWIAIAMPNLESLCIANSNLSDIQECTVKGFQCLKQLDCSNCGFDKWVNQVDKFAHLPHLESLSLDDNPIPTVPHDGGSQPLFPQLLSLQLSGTAISTWMDVEAINSFACLKSLRLKNTPLTANLGQGEVRSLCLARFPRLEYLNASSISRTERIEAERRYVALVSHMLQRSKINDNNDCLANEATILLENPRYQELCETYKNMAIFSNNNNIESGNGESLAGCVYNVTIKSLAPSSCTMEPVVRRLPGTLNVERLKALCSRIFGLDFDLISLYFRINANDSLPIVMDEDDKTLNYYGLCDGAEILMNEIDLSARALDLKMKREEQEKLIAEQDKSIQATQVLKSQKQIF